MNKLAVFVEGYTEVVFIKNLIEEIAGVNNVRIEHREIRGGSTKSRTFERVQAANPDTGQQYFVLIVDCGGDKLVKARVLEEHQNLTNAGYSKIIGIRDVRPDFTHAEIPRLEMGLRTYIKTSLIPVEFILAVLEIEAWFLAEFTHFSRIDPSITVAAIVSTLDFDPEHDDMSARLTPAGDLNRCYAIAGKRYQKQIAKDTIEALDYASVYLVLPTRIPYLERLIGSIGSFLS